MYRGKHLRHSNRGNQEGRREERREERKKRKEHSSTILNNRVGGLCFFFCSVVSIFSPTSVDF